MPIGNWQSAITSLLSATLIIDNCPKYSIEAHLGPEAKALKEAHDEVEEEEDEHLYHTKGWCRELWIKSLGMPAVIPPPEEEKDVKTAIGAERAKHARGQML